MWLFTALRGLWLRSDCFVAENLAPRNDKIAQENCIKKISGTTAYFYQLKGCNMFNQGVKFIYILRTGIKGRGRRIISPGKQPAK